jgi:hypothetical protein
MRKAAEELALPDEPRVDAVLQGGVWRGLETIVFVFRVCGV